MVPDGLCQKLPEMPVQQGQIEQKQVSPLLPDLLLLLVGEQLRSYHDCTFYLAHWPANAYFIMRRPIAEQSSSLISRDKTSMSVIRFDRQFVYVMTYELMTSTLSALYKICTILWFSDSL